MLHLRVIAPADQSSAVADLLAADPGVTHLVVLPGVARQPAGDYLTCDGRARTGCCASSRS